MRKGNVKKYFFLNTIVLFFSFTGCVRDIFINDVRIQLQRSTPYEMNFDPELADPGCPREETCYPEPCANEGVCVPGWSGFKCQCTRDYFGSTCEEGKKKRD